ncbi:MAG TPA: PH domain-containing protein [Vicinamibacterales bacterium]|nr:PH domain-containing protein [Vicinamibacterales bacterium]
MGTAEGVGEGGAGEYRRLDPRYVTVQRITGWVMFGIVMSIWAVMFAAFSLMREDGLRWAVWTLGAFGALTAPPLLWLATGWPPRSYARYSYRIDEAGIEIRSGVVFRRVTTVPRMRVQHTDVAQGPVARRFGLGTLVVYTAGTQYSRVALPGLEYGTAVAIRDTLLPRDGADAV